MLTDNDIIKRVISKSEFAYLHKRAVASAIGGRSNLRTGDERQAKLLQDQLVGHVGAYAGIFALFGNVLPYKISRYYADRYPFHGDGGSDVPGANIDFKSSLRSGNRQMLAHRLAVRPKELHKGTIYVLVLIDLEPAPVAHLIGWATDDMLPGEPDTEGIFEGAYTLRANQLKPLMKIEWFKEDQLEPASSQPRGLFDQASEKQTMEAIDR